MISHSELTTRELVLRADLHILESTKGMTEQQLQSRYDDVIKWAPDGSDWGFVRTMAQFVSGRASASVFVGLWGKDALANLMDRLTGLQHIH